MSFNIVYIFIRAAVTKTIGYPDIARILVLIGMILIDLGAALFALECTLGALKYFLDGLDFSSTNQGRLFFLGKAKFIIN